MDTDSGPLQNPPENTVSPGVPGQVIAPQSPDASLSQPQQQPSAPQQPQPPVAPQSPAPAPDSAAPTPMQTQPQAPVDAYAPTEAPSSWRYGTEEDNSMYAGGDLPPDVSWTAAEFIEHAKSAKWYSLLLLTAVIVAGLDYFFQRDLISVVVILFAAALFGIYAGHKPREQHYHLDDRGLTIGEKQYSYQAYKSFSVTEDGDVTSVVLMPMGRFAVPLVLYVSHDIEDRVIDYLAEFLPIDQHRNDALDGLLRRIRF